MTNKIYSKVSAASRRRILAEAEKMFRDRAYEAVSLAALAQRVNLTKPALYYYFPSKEQLFVAVVKQSIENFFKGLGEIIKASLPIKDKTAAFIRYYLKEKLHRRALFYDFLFKTSPQLKKQCGLVHLLLDRLCQQVITLMQEVKTQQPSVLPNLEIAFLARLFLGTMDSFVIEMMHQDMKKGASQKKINDFVKKLTMYIFVNKR